MVPKYIFDSLLDYCHQHKIVRPAYSVLQDITSGTLDEERTRLSNKLYTLVDKSFREKLSNLLQKDDDFYPLTIVKKAQKDFATSEIRTTLKKHQLLFEIYKQSSRMHR